MRNCCNRTEHYVVKPNTPVYDWPYEYSSSSSSKNNCCCNSEALMVTIGNLLSTLASLLNTIKDTSAGNIDPEQIKNAVTEYLSVVSNATALKDLIDKEIRDKFGMTSNTDIVTLKTLVESIRTDINNLQPIITNITKLTDLAELDPEQLSQYNSRITAVEGNLNTLGSSLTALQNTVNGITDNIADTVNAAVEAKLQDSTTLNTKIEEAINNNTKISKIESDLSSHINDNTKHFTTNDVHVTQEDVNKWNNASSSSSDWDFNVEDGTLNISK